MLNNSPHLSHLVYCIGAMLCSDGVARPASGFPRPPREIRDRLKPVPKSPAGSFRHAPCQTGPFAASRRPGVRKAGYTLIETMIATSLSIIVLAGFFSLTGVFQTWSSNLSLLLERDANLWLAPLLLSRWILPAGNNRWDQAWSGVTFASDRLELKSDIDGPRGFPDSKLSSSFEALALRSSNSNLRVQNNRGSFQPLIKNVAHFKVDSKQSGLLSIHLSAITDRPLLMTREDSPESTELLFFLRNYRSNLFPENP